MLINLKHEILRILRENEEFRYAVACLIGLSEVLERLDKPEEELRKLRENFNKFIELEEKRCKEVNKRFSRSERSLGLQQA